MQRKTQLFIWASLLAAFILGRWSSSSTAVRADSEEIPKIEVQSIRGDSSLVVYYPSLKKMFVYQTPFVGMPGWNCAYSIQLSTPGGKIDRQTCPNPGQQY